MNTHRRQRWAALAGALVLTGAGLGATAAPVGASTGTTGTGATSTDTTDTTDPTDTTERRTTTRTSGGMAVETITRGEDSVTTYGSTGATVQWAAGTDTSAGAVVTPGTAAASTGPGQRSDGGEEVPPTVYEMTLASGMGAAEACEFARDMDEHGCRTSSQVEAGNRDESRPTLDARAGRYYDTICTKFETTKGDGRKHNYTCARRTLDSTTSTHAYLAAQIKATGWVEDPGAVYDRLKVVGTQLRYRNEQSRAVDWAPYSTTSIGGCRDTSVSVEGKRGASYSSTSQVCPERIGPWNSSDYQWFGAKWSSDEEAPADETRGVVAASLQELRKGSGGTGATLYAWLAWS